MDAQALRYWVGFNRIKGVGAARFAALLSYFGDLETAWQASEANLMRALNHQPTCTAIIQARASVDLDRNLAILTNLHAYAITWDDPAYPALLRQIANPPPLLYVRGKLTEADSRALSIVGSRAATEYGVRVARQLATVLTKAGWTIVSGLAKGIDGAAHTAALYAGGRTIAFLGHGIDRVYPAEHLALANQIAANGALITEFPVGTPPESGNFPRRNRLISGITRGTIVVEASMKSGALGIARLALDQNREVFAVPGSIESPQSQGANQLIQEGQAKLIQQAADVLVELGEVGQAPTLMPPLTESVSRSSPAPKRSRTAPPLPIAEPAAESETDSTIDLTILADLDEPTRIVWRCVTASQVIRVDDLSDLSGLPMTQVSTSLTLLEMSGLIRQAGGRVYMLTERA
jgi:DNA processing protein